MRDERAVKTSQDGQAVDSLVQENEALKHENADQVREVTKLQDQIRHLRQYLTHERAYMNTVIDELRNRVQELESTKGRLGERQPNQVRVVCSITYASVYPPIYTFV